MITYMWIGKNIWCCLIISKYMIIDYSAHPLESRNDISDMYPKKKKCNKPRRNDAVFH